MNRQQWKDYVWMQVAFDIAELATCARRKVGAVILNAEGRVIGTGYNGVSPGHKHCTEHPCAGASSPSGQGLESCEAIHAEQNALLACSSLSEVHTVYSTCLPCIHCAKMLATSSVKRIVYVRNYPHQLVPDHLRSRGIVLEQLRGDVDLGSLGVRFREALKAVTSSKD